MLGRLFLLAVVLWCAIPLSPQSVDSDFWGHVQYGWDTWRYGLDRTATYTFTAVGYPWINHENLSELIMAWCVYGLGPTSLLVLKCLLGCLVLVLAVRRARQASPPVHPLTIGLLSVVVSLNLSFYWGLRPHVFTFVLFALLVALTDWCFDGWADHWHLPWPRQMRGPLPAEMNARRLHALWLAPILLAVWTNTHGGFLAGLGVYVVLMSMRVGELLIVKGPAAWKTATYLSVLTLAGALATLLNPYGIELYRWLIQDLSVPRPEILEWHSPAWLSGSSVKLWVLLGLMVWALVASRRPRDATRLVILALVLNEACKHQRHIPFLAILILFWMPVHLQSAIERMGTAARNRTAWCDAAGLVRWASCGLLLVCALLAYRVGTRLSGVPVSNYEYPVDALQFMADQGLTGRLVVAGHWAQYALAVMGARTPDDPGVQVAFDGRFRTCYPQHLADMHFDFFLGDGGPDKRYRSPTSPPADGKRVLEYDDPELVLLNRHEPFPVSIMQSVQDEWVLLYQDQLAQLWGRRSVFDREGQAAYFPPQRRQLVASAPASTVLWPAAPRQRDRNRLARSSVLSESGQDRPSIRRSK
jgi:hypothetical protein